MLSDKDRIFTNVYGWQGADLAAAKARGDWDNTKALIKLGHEEVIEQVKASGLRGRGGAGFPNRAEMVIYAERSQRPSALFGGER